MTTSSHTESRRGRRTGDGAVTFNAQHFLLLDPGEYCNGEELMVTTAICVLAVDAWDHQYPVSI